jgi:hypothetical protein
VQRVHTALRDSLSAGLQWLVWARCYNDLVNQPSKGHVNESNGNGPVYRHPVREYAIQTIQDHQLRGDRTKDVQVDGVGGESTGT